MKIFAYLRHRTLLRSILLFLLPLCSHQAGGQIVWSSSSGSVWLTGSFWTGGAVPTGSQEARFNAAPSSGSTGIGIDLGGTTNNGANNQAVGAINVTSSRTAALIIGNNSVAADGILTINGATVNGTSNVSLANYAINGVNRQTLTLQNIQGSGTKTMTLNLPTGNTILAGGGASATAIGNTINITSSVSGSGPVFLGSGTWNGATGVAGGLLKFGAANSFTGGVIVGSTSATYNSGILELDNKLAINNISGNDITINPYSELYLNSTTGDTFSTGNITLNLNGPGNTATLTNIGGALVTGSGKTFVWTGPLLLQSDARIATIGTSTLTVQGNVTGSGALIKTANGSNGALILNGSGNSWSGGTVVGGGSLIITTGSSLGSSELTMAGFTAGVNTNLTLNNTAQTLTALSSSFVPTSGTITQTLSLASGHTLTLNFTTDQVYGAGAVNTLSSLISGAGKVIKNGVGRLTLTGKGTHITGGLRINAGEIQINPCGAFTMSAPDTLNGGSISTVGDTSTTGSAANIAMGNLALLDNSNIYLGNTVPHALKFAVSNAIAWTAGKTLYVHNWTGTWGAGISGTAGKLFMGTNASGVTAGQLAQILFVDGAGNYFPALQLSTGEIIPKKPVITTTPAAYGPFLNTSSHSFLVAFTTSAGTMTGMYKVQLSDTSGAFTADTTTGILDSGYTSPINVTLPAGTLFGYYRVRVINGSPYPIYGSDNGSDINVITPPPTITNVSPYSGIPGDTVTITGTNFNTVPGNNIVWFGATKANVISGGTTTSIGVIVPTGATFAPISVKPPNVLFGYSKFPFLPTFNGNAFPTTTFNMKAKVDFSVGTGPNTAVIGDLDGDGKPDLVVANTNSGSGTTLSIYRNTSTYGVLNSSSFTSAGTLTTGTGPANVAISDMDGDGKPDLMVTSLASASVSIFRNTSSPGTISFATRGNVSTISTGVVGAQPFEVTVADFDGDGKPDLATTSPYTGAANSTISVMRNVSSLGALTSSSFSTAVSFITPAALGSNSAPIGICNGDFDGDGKPDIAVACSSAAAVAVYRNTGTAGVINSGTFAAGQSFSVGSAGANPIDVVAGDIDGDGKLDLILSNSGSSRISVLRNTSTSGSISFATNVQFTTGSTPTGLALADMNGDGKLDVLVTNAGANSVSLFRNTATSGTINSASLAAKVDFATGSVPYGVNVADLDGNTIPDIVTGNNSGNSISVIKSNPLPLTGTISGSLSVCAGGDTTQLYSTITGGYWRLTNARATIDTNGLVTGVTAGSDTVIYTMVVNGDTNSTTAIITVNVLPAVAAITGPSTVCPAATINLADATAGGVWGVTNSNASISGGGVLTGITPGLDTVTYKVTNGFGCVSTASKEVSINNSPNAGVITGASSVCSGANTTLADTIAGGTWTSSNTAIASVGGGTGIVYGITPGSVTITYSTTTCGAAYTTFGITVTTVPAAPAPITGSTSICSGGNTTLTDTSAGGTWSSSNTAIATVHSATGVVTGIAPGNATISYTRSNVCGITAATRIVTVFSNLSASITAATTPCTGHSASITITGTTDARITYRIDGDPDSDTVLTGGTFTWVTPPVTAPHFYILHTVYNGGCSLTLDTFAYITPQQMQWTGGSAGVETNWNTAANWSCGFVPTVTDDVYIPGGSFYMPILASSESATTNSLNIGNGILLTVNTSATLNVTGNLANAGTITGAGVVILNGMASQNISGTGTINQLALNNSAGASIDSGARVTINNTLEITSGNFATNDSLVLWSDSATTARVAPSAGTIIGNTKVMQYVSGGYRRYRFWSHPFSNNIALNQLVNYVDITGPGGAANGFTPTATNSPSAFWYNPAVGNSALSYDPGWRPFTDANGTADSNRVHKHQGFRLFIRGAKGQGLGYDAYTPSPVTIGMWGNLNQGRQKITLQKGGAANQDYNMVGNPYPSPADIGTVIYDAKVAGNIAGSAFYVFNPALGAAGQYQVIPITNTPYYLQANTAFQVRAANNGDSLVFNESNKGVNATTNLLKATSEYFTLSVFDDQGALWDQLIINANTTASNTEDDLDARKLAGPGFNLYTITEDGRKLAIDARPVNKGTIIPVGIKSDYYQKMAFAAGNLSASGMNGLLLHDRYLDSFIDLATQPVYQFTIDKNTSSQGDNRFALVFKGDVAVQQTAVFEVYPNPATETVTVQINQSDKPCTISLFNVKGEQVFRTTIAAQATSAKMDVANFAPGLYQVQADNGKRKTIKSLIIQ